MLDFGNAISPDTIGSIGIIPCQRVKGVHYKYTELLKETRHIMERKGCSGRDRKVENCIRVEFPRVTACSFRKNS